MSIKIELTQGYTAIIDDVDADLAEHLWCTHVPRWGGPMAIRHQQGTKRDSPPIYLNRIILRRIVGRGLSSNEKTHFKDGDTLNNQRSNLSIASNAEIAMKQRVRVDNTSGYKGVSYNKRVGKYIAYICVNGKRKWLGYHDTLQSAAEARYFAEQEYFGEFASQEFPDFGDID